MKNILILLLNFFTVGLNAQTTQKRPDDIRTPILPKDHKGTLKIHVRGDEYSYVKDNYKKVNKKLLNSTEWKYEYDDSNFEIIEFDNDSITTITHASYLDTPYEFKRPYYFSDTPDLIWDKSKVGKKHKGKYLVVKTWLNTDGIVRECEHLKKHSSVDRLLDFTGEILKMAPIVERGTFAIPSIKEYKKVK